MEKIPVSDFVLLDDYLGKHPVRIDLVYAKPAHKDNMFKTGIYRPDARMWGHRDLVDITMRAADICYKKTKYVFELKDCLRTVEAQERVTQTEIMKANPSWQQEPNRLFAPPGKGGHPRGMAIDIILIDENGGEVDMGTAFDYLAPNHRVSNPSSRSFRDFSPQILQNRKILEDAMMQASKEAGRELLPLPDEWWDFRFPNSYTGQFEPVYDRDLPPHMRMTAA